MKVTKETLAKLPEKEQSLIKSLLIDLQEINDSKLKPAIYIDWCNEHTEWSSERTEPCPDYYGTYTIRNSYNNELIGVEMDLNTLDIVLCALNNYVIDI